MHYIPSTPPRPYYGYVNMPEGDPINQQVAPHQIVETLLAGIQKHSSAVDFYNRLASKAPSQSHKAHILHALETKKVHLKQFTDLYTNLTGMQPVYQVKKDTFHSYKEGLQKAYETERANYVEYQNIDLLSQHPLVQNIFWYAHIGQKENANRIGLLHEEIVKKIEDHGAKPFVVNIDKATKRNNTYRTALWTGNKLQVTLMSIDVGDDIGLEVHPEIDQFIRIEAGQGLVQMGSSRDKLDFKEKAADDFAIMIPAGTWHNITNTGNIPLKLYAIYAPPEHPFGTVHKTKKEAMDSE